MGRTIGILVTLVVGILAGYTLQLQERLRSLTSERMEQPSGPETDSEPVDQAPLQGTNTLVTVPVPSAQATVPDKRAGRKPASSEIMVSDAGKFAENSDLDLQSLEVEDQRRMLIELGKKNARLRLEMLDLRKTNARLSAALAALQAELDRRTSVETQAAFKKPVPVADHEVATFQEARLLDTNEPLGLVVLNVGASQGVKQGMSFSVLRNNEVIGKIRVFEVRPAVSSAEILEKGRVSFQAGDRVVLGKNDGS